MNFIAFFGCNTEKNMERNHHELQELTNREELSEALS
jgi:hypothetical protein